MKALVFGLILLFAGSAYASLPALKVQGMKLVDPKGKAVTFKGVNLGNWLMIEFWMLGLSDVKNIPGDQFELEKLLTERFGEAEKERLMDAYRESWITERDFKLMPTFGFNVVRLPMNYRQFEDDLIPFHLKPNCWKWIDRAIDLSEKHGLYVILDMHGVQGGQSPYDHTGHSNQNHLKDDENYSKRLAWLWGEFAKKYRKRSAVLAYDVFNEPYGTPKDIQVKVFKSSLAEIRKNDPEKLVFAMGNFDDFQHYGDPKANGWHNVGFQMHYYPGMFGNGEPVVKTHIEHFRHLASVAQIVKKLDVPFLIGEMNVVFDKAGGARMMQRYYETHAKYGWMTTMWSWKTYSAEGGLGDAGWGAVRNKNPMHTVDFHKATAKEIEAYFRSFAVDPLAINVPLQKALSGKAGPPPPLPVPEPGRTSAPQGELSGWTQADLGASLKGGLKLLSEGRFNLFGGGGDVWATEDQCRLLYQEVEGDFEIEVALDEMEDLHPYSKAGLMVRASTDPKSPTVILTTFASGEVQLAHRDESGKDMAGFPTRKGKLKGLQLKLVRSGGKWTAFRKPAGGEWEKVGETPDLLPKKVIAGVLALSHDNSQLIKIVYRGLRLTKP